MIAPMDTPDTRWVMPLAAGVSRVEYGLQMMRSDVVSGAVTNARSSQSRVAVLPMMRRV